MLEDVIIQVLYIVVVKFGILGSFFMIRNQWRRLSLEEREEIHQQGHILTG